MFFDSIQFSHKWINFPFWVLILKVLGFLFVTTHLRASRSFDKGRCTFVFLLLFVLAIFSYTYLMLLVGITMNFSFVERDYMLVSNLMQWTDFVFVRPTHWVPVSKPTCNERWFAYTLDDVHSFSKPYGIRRIIHPSLYASSHVKYFSISNSVNIWDWIKCECECLTN